MVYFLADSEMYRIPNYVYYMTTEKKKQTDYRGFIHFLCLLQQSGQKGTLYVCKTNALGGDRMKEYQERETELVKKAKKVNLKLI